MKRLLLIAAAALALLAPSAQAAFNIDGFDVEYAKEGGAPATQAGSHPTAITSSIQFSHKFSPEAGKEVGDGSPKDLRFELPPGLVGDRDAVPHCPNATFLDREFIEGNGGIPVSACPDNTALGFLRVFAPGESPSAGEATAAYNLIPPPGVAAKIGFIFLNVPIALQVRVNPEPPHNLIATLQNTSDIEPVGASALTLWGNPASATHNAQRGRCLANTILTNCEAKIPERAFLTLPRSCEGPLFTHYEANSWETPQTYVAGNSASALLTDGCEQLGFDAAINAKPTTEQAESPTGLDFGLEIEDKGLTDPAGNAQSDLKKATVTLPEGMTVNPAVAAGLSACSPADLARESVESEPGQGCPQSSKLGSVEVETPLLAGEVLQGQVFAATQDDPATTTPGAENPFDSMIAIYMVIKDRDLGLLVKQAGRVDPDPRTGRLTTVFGEPGQEVPQFPFSHLRFHFRPATPSPLVTPPNCGQFTANAQFTPWSNPAAALPFSAGFPITQGIGGGSCPSGTPPFHPTMSAGSASNTAGAYSPFYLRLTRQDGEQEATRLDAILPKGVVGKIAGVPQCSDAAIAAAKTKTGRQELAAPSCPAASQVGRTIGGAGVGPELVYVPGQVYLAGPFGGDPLSIVAITPAVAGPFDAGTVVVRQALSLDESSGEVLIDGSHSDPIPHILKGIPLKLRDLRVYVDRPDFTLNPTGCIPQSTRANVFGSAADLFSPADDTPAALSSPYQATNCAALGFKPKLTLALKGGTKRNDHPALSSTLTYPKGPGYANVGKAVVKLPPSEFIDNAHIQNPCTRVQFAAHQCPKGSILGSAKAVTPLLDQPLEGPVYFRSNGGERLLPDVVADLNGQFHIVLVGKVDARKGRIRTTFDQVPDAPVSSFTLKLYGGKRGLLVNSRNLCTKALKADVALTGQNGRPQETRPVVKTSCKGKGAKKKGAKQQKRRG